MSMKPPLLVAHRGASGHAPENTMAAFQLALEMKVDGIELDVHMSRDGSIVVIHDSTVNRTTNGRGRISARTLPELRSLDAGSWFNIAFPEKARREYAGQQIPTLDNVLELVQDRARLFIEMKDPHRYPDSLESKLLYMVRRHRMQDRVIFLSFDQRALRKMRDLDPTIPVALLISTFRGDPVEAARSLHGCGLAVQHRRLRPTLAEKALASNLSLIAWTVDNPKDMDRMIKAGASAIITNYPDRFATS
jgi:glycerophosphoryl diester phosphodiesterase